MSNLKQPTLASSNGASRFEIQRIESNSSQLIVEWADGHTSQFHPFWLRDNCRCPLCCAEGTTQRLLDSLDIPADVTLLEATINAADRLEVTWSDGNHASRYEARWLRENCCSEVERNHRRPQPVLWGANLADDVPEIDYGEAKDSDRGRHKLLRLVIDFGLAIIRNVPCNSGEVLNVASLFGFVRETNYGRMFDVRTIPSPNNLAYSAQGLSVHTDNVYRDPVPGLQLLHCLEASCTGGDSIFVDGFRAVGELRKRDPRGFRTLVRHPRLFRYADGEVDLQREDHLILLDADENVSGIRYNNRSASTLSIPENEIDAYYAAYRSFGRLLTEPAQQLQLRMKGGDLAIFDNERVLHGRTAFDPNSGRRHLQGCYVGKDELTSRARVLVARLETAGGG